MRGTNTIFLNESTLIEAMQEYLNARYAQKPPTVISVGYNGSSFVVTTSDPIKKTATTPTEYMQPNQPRDSDHE